MSQARLEIRRRVLANGIVLLGHSQPSSRAALLRVSIQSGARHDATTTAGRARLAGSMLRRGTARWNFESLSELTDANGMALTVDVGRHSTDVSIRCLVEDLPLATTIAREVVSRPTFPADQLERLRGEVLTGLREADHDTRAVADRVFRERAYPDGHPYARRVSGYVETVSAIEAPALAEFHAATFHPARTMIALAGGVDVAVGLDAVASAFADWDGRPPPPDVQLAPAPVPDELARIDRGLPGKSQSDIVLGRPSIPRTHPDYYALDLGNLILGRMGLNGRIGANVRERLGLAYYSYSDLEGGPGPGAWTARAGVNPANVERAIEAIADEIGRIVSQPVEPEEIADASSYLTGILPLALESSDGIARTMLSIETYDLGIDYVDRYPDIIRALTRDDVLRATRAYLDPARNIVAVTGPES